MVQICYRICVLLKTGTCKSQISSSEMGGGGGESRTRVKKDRKLGHLTGSISAACNS